MFGLHMGMTLFFKHSHLKPLEYFFLGSLSEEMPLCQLDNVAHFRISSISMDTATHSSMQTCLRVSHLESELKLGFVSSSVN